MTERGALAGGAWQDASIERIETATPTVKTLLLRPTHTVEFIPGQHVDIRLTAPDGYTAVRSYSVTSAPGERTIELAVERLREGEVSPYFHDIAVPGDVIEIRGPFTQHFVWRPEHDGAVLLVGGGSGIAPFLSMLRHRASVAHAPPTMLLYSARTWNDVILRDELLRHEAVQAGLQLRFTITQGSLSDGVSARGADYTRRIDETMLRECLGSMPVAPARCYVCGNNGFVGTVADALVAIGVDPATVRTERYGE